MTGEVENIVKGRLEKSQEFDSTRKIIGVAEQNLQPNANGVIALAKQNAFTIEKKDESALETLDSVLDVTSVKEDKVESLELNKQSTEIPQVETSSFNQGVVQNNTTAQVGSKFTSELDSMTMSAEKNAQFDGNAQSENNVVLENPISVENPNALSKLTNPLEEIAEEIDEKKDANHHEVNFDLQMPKLPTNITLPESTEPIGEIFEKVPNKETTVQSQQENPNIQSESVASMFEIPSNQSEMELGPNAADMGELLKKITEISQLFSKELAELEEMVKKSEKKNQNEIPSLVDSTQEFQNDLVNDALSQINNMAIPSTGTETLTL